METVFSAPNKGPHYSTADVCAADALLNNGYSLGLDVVGIGAGFLPGSSLAVRGTQFVLSVAGMGSARNSAPEHNLQPHDTVGILSSIANYFLSAANLAVPKALEEMLPFVSKNLPIVGAGISSVGLYNDLNKSESDYDACIKELGGH